jgi:predicted RNase H-like HicB family nuclease
MLIPDTEEGGYVAEVLELPGCISDGDTPEEAYRNLQEAMEGWIATAIDHDQPIPDPVGDREYGGHFPLRISTELHRAAALRAIQEGISLNQWFGKAIAAQVAGESLAERLSVQIADKVVERISVGVSGGFYMQLGGVRTAAPTSSEVLEALLTRPETEDTTLNAPDTTMRLAAPGFRGLVNVPETREKKVRQDA